MTGTRTGRPARSGATPLTLTAPANSDSLVVGPTELLARQAGAAAPSGVVELTGPPSPAATTRPLEHPAYDWSMRTNVQSSSSGRVPNRPPPFTFVV
jgi:hypothetical protein